MTRLELNLSFRLSSFREPLHGSKLDERFRAAEWEDVVVKTLESLYPEAEVRHTGGKNERGVDILLRIPNQFAKNIRDGSDWIILIQVKDYKGTIYGTEAIDQLRQGLDAYGQEGQIVTLVVMSNAENIDENCSKAAQILENEKNIPVLLVARDNFIDFIANGALRN